MVYREATLRIAMRYVGVPVALVLGACARDAAAPDTSALPNADVAVVASDAAAQDVELMRGPGGMFGLRLPADPSRFECGSFTRGDITIIRTCTFVDAAGAVQDAYDPATTDTVRLHAAVSGTISRDRWTGAVNRVRDYTASGLAGDETSITWNGTGSDTTTKVRSRDGADVQYDMTSADTVDNVVIPVPRTETSWPLSGTIVKHFKVTITGGPHDGTTHQRDVMIAFDGTQYATVTVNGETFTVDLANRQCGEGRHWRGRGGEVGFHR